MTWLFSPQEQEDSRKAVPREFLTSELCEQKGGDALIYTTPGLLVVQRKKVPFDFLRSLEDGRLARETSLMRDSAPFKLLVMEGKFMYDGEDHVIAGFKSRFTRQQIRGVLWSVRYVKGIDIEWTTCPEETWRLAAQLEDYLNGGSHTSLFVRPKPKGEWGVLSVDERELWWVQGLPGIGVGVGGRLLKEFSPLELCNASIEELSTVVMVGKKKAETIFRFLRRI